MPGDTMPLSAHFSNAHVILGIVAGLGEMYEVRLCRVVGTDYLIRLIRACVKARRRPLD